MNILLYDDESIHDSFYPLSSTRSVATLRCGILTLSEKWENTLSANVYIQTMDFLQCLYPDKLEHYDLYVKSNVLPSQGLLEEIESLATNESLWYKGVLIAYKNKGFTERKEIEGVLIVEKPWELLDFNTIEIEEDILRLGLIPSVGNVLNTTIYQKNNVYIDKSANIKSVVINAEKGSVYIAPNVTVSEGCVLKGPLAILDGAEITMGAKLRNGNTIGPKCVVGGELKNVIIQGYSNKGHEGYLGDSVVGEWVNLGANTNVSNLKNNYSNIRMWDKDVVDYVDSGRWKLGAIIGDYVHTGISTMLNSGTTIGIGSNVFGAGYQSKYIPDFSWGANGVVYQIDKFLQMVAKLKSLKGKSLSEEESKVLKKISE